MQDAENKAPQTLAARFDHLRDVMSKDDFLRNRGLSNEVGFYIFAYPAEQELEVRALTADLVAASASGRIVSPDGLACRVHERNLWQLFLSACGQKLGPDYLAKMEKLEARRGSDSLLARMQKIVGPEVYAEQMDWAPAAPHRPGDVLLITGVGQVYPFMRLHNVLENAQHRFTDIPVVALYPGVYDARTLSLFGKLEDGNYYRAFNII